MSTVRRALRFSLSNVKIRKAIHNSMAVGLFPFIYVAMKLGVSEEKLESLLGVKPDHLDIPPPPPPSSHYEEEHY